MDVKCIKPGTVTNTADFLIPLRKTLVLTSKAE